MPWQVLPVTSAFHKCIVQILDAWFIIHFPVNKPVKVPENEPNTWTLPPKW